MAEETVVAETRRPSKKRKMGPKKSRKPTKKQKQFMGMKGRVKIDPKLKKFLRKKARDYNSDDDGDVGSEEETVGDGNEGSLSDGDDKEEENDERQGFGSDNDDEHGEIQPGVTKLNEGCRAFRIAFKSIMKKTLKKSEADEPLGPVLSVHKKLLAKKLAEEETERKEKGKAKKEKRLVAEKGHVKPANYLDSHDKFLIGVATKGVVKLFNAVNKAQHAQKGLNPSRSKDEKVIKKRKKEAFFSELSKPVTDAASKARPSSGPVDSEGPSWAPLQHNYMLTNSKLKNWDKMEDTSVADDIGRISDDSSSDDE